MIALLTALSGGLGGVARFYVDSRVNRAHRSVMPWGTLVVNASACLLLGLFTGIGLAHAPGAWLTVLGTGFTGGYSTFSTAFVETGRLLLQRRWGLAAAQGIGMMVLCLALALAGIWLGELI